MSLVSGEILQRSTSQRRAADFFKVPVSITGRRDCNWHSISASAQRERTMHDPDQEIQFAEQRWPVRVIQDATGSVMATPVEQS
jgi:hypothetical protein